MRNENPRSSIEPPLISIVIPVYNDWAPLENCLQSLATQISPPSFEVIVVDDGSTSEAPNLNFGRDFPLPLRIIRQSHAGTSEARNSGVAASSGSVLLFTDADCVLDAHCLRNLSDAVMNDDGSSCFQLNLTGDCSHVVGRAEKLLLSSIQNFTLNHEGYIRYLNTSGTAVRRSKLKSGSPLFERRAHRAQDTLLLSNLIRNGELPRFVASATVLHDVRSTVLKYLWKGLHTGYTEGWTYQTIRSQSVTIRSTFPERYRILAMMCNASLSPDYGIRPLVVVFLRQSLSLFGYLVYRWFWWGRSSIHSEGS